MILSVDISSNFSQAFHVVYVLFTNLFNMLNNLTMFGFTLVDLFFTFIIIGFIIGLFFHIPRSSSFFNRKGDN